MLTVTTHAGPVEVREEGDPNGDPVVLLHGLGRSENSLWLMEEALTAGGYVVSEPENCQELGWELEARRGGCRFWMRVTKIAEFVVATQDMTFRLWPKRPSYIEFRRELHSALASDPRFTEIRWFDDVLPTDGGDWSAEPA